jgi:hypothetical protein
MMYNANDYAIYHVAIHVDVGFDTMLLTKQNG